MDIVLIILGVLGVGAIIIAGYVFTVAARDNASDNNRSPRAGDDLPGARGFVARSNIERRSGAVVQFPLTVNSVVIPQDRRQLPERRLTA